MLDLQLFKRLVSIRPNSEKHNHRFAVSPQLRKLIKERDSNTCRLCSRTKKLVVHHIVPNGISEENNLIVLCRYCHRFVHSWLWDKGYVQEAQHVDPARYVTPEIQHAYMENVKIR